ncbi:NAD-P-binding protein [Lentinus tigrinus ALCF2SS1-7]|uniref:NAD-P-binding protein n=1 Tax=Lentinus tigrinus ALCF2SS1-6 TaxID=1328759 RepID=A0A5C2S2D1_9APHY|nr:NAD-P-binding protein [Lentinus tigrinus ALCF2SS1-6]RPD78794.1 NAD-P-binding protein [Lentinus tigrinus ALCF2SS1-7]
MATTNPLVLVLGGSGLTGQSIVDGLLKSGSFRVAALVRSQSVTKAATEKLKTSGVEIRVGDLTDDYERLKEHLQGVDILISAVNARVVGQQREIFRAAKEVGVQRIVPCDWATPGERGVRVLTDVKFDIRDFVKELGVPYTFIDVGWWMQFYLPLPLRSTVVPKVKAMTWSFYGTGESKNLLTNLHHIGTWVARIITDPRTINKAVIIWEEEVMQKDAHEIGARVSGDGDALRSKRIQLSEDDIKKQIADGRVLYDKNPTDYMSTVPLIWAQYMYSMHFLQENTLKNAKRLGYLDARELYPDIPTQSLEEYAKEFYGLPEPGVVLVRE